MKTARTKAIRDALKILGRNDDARLRAAIEAQKVRCRVAEMVLEAREQKRVTQAGLAKLMGTRQSVISRTEDADDDGSVTVATLTRLLAVLGMNLTFEAVPARNTAWLSRPATARSRRPKLPTRFAEHELVCLAGFGFERWLGLQDRAAVGRDRQLNLAGRYAEETEATP